MKGKGLVFTLSDGDNGNNYNSGIVRDTDILLVINELKAAGAEVISVNEQRIVNISAIKNITDEEILINDQRVESPFIIKAIGNPEYLESAVKMKGGVVDALSPYGLKINISKENDITIPKYEGVLKLQYATVK